MVGTSQTRRLQGRVDLRPHSVFKGTLVEEKFLAGMLQGVGIGVTGDRPASAKAQGGEQQVRTGTPSCYLFLQATAACGGQLLLLQRIAVVQRETQHLVLQLQHLVEVGADLTLHAAVVSLQLTQALSAGLGLVQALLQLLALPQQRLLLPLLLAQLLLQAPDGPGQALGQLGRLHEPCGMGQEGQGLLILQGLAS